MAEDLTDHRKAVDRAPGPKVEIPFTDALWGECRWCGEVILQDGERYNRRRWHIECQREYTSQLNQTFRGILWERDNGICATCGTQCHDRGWSSTVYTIENRGGEWQEGWHVDHIIELVDGGEDVVENMQTLCIPCHKIKTAEQAGERARKRREEKAGFTGNLFDEEAING